jgi:hypothetical protein
MRLSAVYLTFGAYPNSLFGQVFWYNNFNVYSTTVPVGNIQSILDDTEKTLSASELYDINLT